MNPLLSATILTLYPDMFPGPLGQSLAGKALEEGIWHYNALNIRNFATDKHKTVDDTPYGGGAGMVMRADVVDAAISAAKQANPNAQLIYFSPRGVPLTQPLVRQCVAARSLILLCGRFEGVDQRVLDYHQPLEISLGDYILSGGEMAALTLLDACIRLLPGVMGAADSATEESFSIAPLPETPAPPKNPTNAGEWAAQKNVEKNLETTQQCAGLLEYSHYTRPSLWRGLSVPEVLLSGNHAQIAAWRKADAERITRERRPDLLARPAPSDTK